MGGSSPKAAKEGKACSTVCKSDPTLGSRLWGDQNAPSTWLNKMKSFLGERRVGWTKSLSRN